tara:strand:- start:767 stop:1963 length:1197 start_codon:yes stop_codon:yes gene_type:complete
MGIKRWAGGTADFLTFNKWDFDKRNAPTGGDVTAKVTGSTEQTTQSGAVKSGKSAYGSPDFLSYPLNRSPNAKEDSLLIQAVKYLPPDKGDGIGSPGFEGGNDGLKKEYGKFADGTGGPVKYKTQMGRGMSSRYDQYSKGNAGFKEKTKFYIELPIPQQISDTTSVTWGESTMNLFTIMGMDIANSMMQKSGGDNWDDLMTMVTQGVQIEGIEQGGTLSNTLRSTLAGLAVNQFGANVTANNVLSRGSGNILNSNKELLFDGVNLREFRFDVTFTAREDAEGERIKKIIRSLKQAMSPKADGLGSSEYSSSGGSSAGVFISSPDLFLLRYLSGGKPHPFLNVFKPCALAALSVNYTGNGNYATYSNGTPVHIKMQMTFKETNPVYAEDYTDAVPGVGY